MAALAPKRLVLIILVWLQFKHFTMHTCNIILTIATTAISNPWLNLFVPLALSYPHGTSLTCDAFRLGILSIATFDIGFRMAKAQGEGAKQSDNAMYELSRAQRGRALELLRVAKIAGHLEPEKAGSVEMDMTLGAVLMLSIRDVRIIPPRPQLRYTTTTI